MNRRYACLALAVFASCVLSLPAFAWSGGKPGKAPPLPKPKVEDALHHGKKDGYEFLFTRFPMKKDGKMTFLMAWITTPEGKPLEGTAVTFSVTGPDQKEKKVKTMAMSGGYGESFDFSPKGEYLIGTGFTNAGKNLDYEWKWEIK